MAGKEIGRQLTLPGREFRIVGARALLRQELDNLYNGTQALIRERSRAQWGARDRQHNSYTINAATAETRIGLDVLLIFMEGPRAEMLIFWPQMPDEESQDLLFIRRSKESNPQFNFFSFSVDGFDFLPHDYEEKIIFLERQEDLFTLDDYHELALEMMTFDGPAQRKGPVRTTVRMMPRMAAFLGRLFLDDSNETNFLGKKKIPLAKARRMIRQFRFGDLSKKSNVIFDRRFFLPASPN
ncbi:hypothetical protein HYT17_03665 [Candidatus Microgenomates bacterium]|nr:hypothetical protein [Candidatus Microgenomates bacterium]